MLYACIIEPTGILGIGDHWYNLSDRSLWRYEVVAIPGNATIGKLEWVKLVPGTYGSWSPPASASPGDLWVNLNDPYHIPHQYSGTTHPSNQFAWTPVVPVTFNFPPLNPLQGTIWRDSLSLHDYIWHAGSVWTDITPIPIGGGATGQTSLRQSGRPICPACFVPMTGSVCSHCGHTVNSAAPLVAGSSLVSNGTGPVGVTIPPNVSSGGAANNIVITNNGQNNLTVQGATTALMSINQSALSIHGLVEIFMDGTIVYGPNYTPDKTAKAMWDAIAQFSPIYKENKRIKILEDLNDHLFKEIQAYVNAGFKLPEPKKPVDPNAAWNAAMGVII